MTVQAVSQWETGQSGASHRRIELLAQLLGVDWDWLGYGADLPDPSIKPTLSVEEPLDFQKAPMCNRNEILTWVTNFPELDVEIEDALDFHSKDEQFDIHREWFDPRFPPTGVVFAFGIETISMAEYFQRGDVMICDTGIQPSPGDYILVHVPLLDQVIFRKMRERRSDAGERIVDLVPENPDYPTVTLNSGDGDRIIGTMVEHRRYRRRRGRELLDHLSASRLGRSRDT